MRAPDMLGLRHPLFMQGSDGCEVKWFHIDPIRMNHLYMASLTMYLPSLT
jgi:hypothetical protein